MKLASKIATGLAVLGLASPVLAADGAAAPQPTSQAQQAAPAPASKHHRHAKKVAQADAKKAEAKKPEPKKPDEKKPDAKAPAAVSSPATTR